MLFVPGNAQHIGARSEQQDSFAFSDPDDKHFAKHAGVLAVVADGMGGMSRGKSASRTAVTSFLNAYRQKPVSETIPAALQRALKESHLAVCQTARQLGEPDGIGTTLVAAVAYKGHLYWISAGDSRLYLLRDGRATRVTMDHAHGTKLWAEVAAGHMERQEALADTQRSHLTSYLGATTLADVDVALRPFPLMDGDTIVLCTDGIYRMLSDDEIVTAFCGGRTPNDGCETLQALVLEKSDGRQDNLTVIAFGCQPDSPSRTAAVLGTLASRRKIILLGLLLCVQLLLIYVLSAPLIRDHTEIQKPQAPTPLPKSVGKALGDAPPVSSKGKQNSKHSPSKQKPAQQQEGTPHQ
jgi:protein phosphatase